MKGPGVASPRPLSPFYNVRALQRLETDADQEILASFFPSTAHPSLILRKARASSKEDGLCRW
eukprot:scaffold302_cov247-Pinguiococcus_pyrenoidosus.AAC.28